MKLKLLPYIICIFFTQSIFAQTKNWVGFTSDWHDANNWEPVGVPTPTSDVRIDVVHPNNPNVPVADPTISSIAIAQTLILLNFDADLTVNLGATLTVEHNTGNIVTIQNALIINNGTINITNTFPTFAGNTAGIKIFLDGQLENHGIININNTANACFEFFTGGDLTNFAGGNIHTEGRNLIRINAPDSKFTNNVNATFTGVASGTNSSIVINPGLLDNAGIIDVTGSIELYTTNTILNNLSCGSIIVNGNYFNNTSAKTNNYGLLDIRGNVNNSVSQNNLKNFHTIIANTFNHIYRNDAVQINRNASNTTIFSLGIGNSVSIDGIYKNSLATDLAGNYTLNTNTFDPRFIGAGLQTLYVKTTFSGCTIIAPISYTRVQSRRYVSTILAGNGSGDSWANASNDMQAMINISTPGDSVWVAAGVYKPLKDGSGNASPADISKKLFYMKSAVSLIGGFAGTETEYNQRDFQTNKTIISGDLDNNDDFNNADGNFINESHTEITGNNSYQLMVFLTCDIYTKLEGFIFTGARGSLTNISQLVNGSSVNAIYGSAMHLSISFPTIKNCVFIGNKSQYGTTYNNTTSSTITDAPTFSACQFINNYAQYGGGMFIHRNNTNVDHTVFLGNSSTDGGAINVSSNMQSNRNITLSNLTIVNNTANSGKAISLDNGNTTIKNSIIWNTTGYDGGNVVLGGGTLSSSYSILQNSTMGGAWNNGYGTDGGNNYDSNPSFTDLNDVDGADNKYFTTDDGLSLSTCSPGIDQAVVSNFSNLDIANQAVFNAIYDMGAYERQAVACPIYSGSASCETIVLNNVSGNNLYKFYNNNGIVAELNPNGLDLGTVTLEVSDPTGAISYNGGYVLGRNMNFTSSNYTNGATMPNTYTLKMYHKDVELAEYNSQTGTSTALSGLNYIWKGGGTGCNIATYGGTASGTILAANISNGEFGTGNDGFYLQFDLDHFTIFASQVPLSGPLPVQIIEFYGKNNGQNNQLFWKTSNEKNFDRFEIQRSENGKEFENIGKVKAIGGAGENFVYEFIDNQNSSFITHRSSFFFRLKLIDLDGSYTFSKIIFIENKRETETVGNIYPNPSISEQTFININTEEKDIWLISVYDLTGKLSHTESVELQKGTNKVAISELKNGLNFVKFENKSRSFTRKIIRQ